MNNNHQIKFIVLLFAMSLLFTTPLVAKESMTKFKINWPIGWNVSEKKKENRNLKTSYIVLALKTLNNKPEAFLTIHEMPRNDGEKANLEYEFEVMIKTITKLARKNKSNLEIIKKEAFKFKSHPAFKAAMTMEINGSKITQEITMALTNKYMYAITSAHLNEIKTENSKAIEKALDTLELF